MQEKWLRCRIGPGMFSDEFVVTVTSILAAGQSDRSLFVARDLVKPESAGANGHVRVRAFERDRTWWAILPNEDQEAIPVGPSDLIAT